MDTIDELMLAPTANPLRSSVTQPQSYIPQLPLETHHVPTLPSAPKAAPALVSIQTKGLPGAPGVHTPNEDGPAVNKFAFSMIMPHQQQQIRPQHLIDGKMTPPLVNGQDDIGALTGLLAMTDLNEPSQVWPQ